MGRPAVFGAADASERASEMFLRTGAFFSSILSEFLKNLVALHILRESGSGTRKILERELMQCGYTVEAFRANVCISSFKLIRHLVSEGCGVSFLYEAVVKNDAQFGHFSCPPLTGVHELNVVCLKNTNVPALARRFLDL